MTLDAEPKIEGLEIIAAGVTQRFDVYDQALDAIKDVSGSGPLLEGETEVRRKAAEQAKAEAIRYLREKLESNPDQASNLVKILESKCQTKNFTFSEISADLVQNLIQPKAVETQPEGVMTMVRDIRSDAAAAVQTRPTATPAIVGSVSSR